MRRAGAGNLLFTLQGPEQQNIEYTQYMPGSKHTLDRGMHLGANRIAKQILAVGIAMQGPTAAIAFYKEKLGFTPDPSLRTGQTWLDLPGTSGERVQIVQRAPDTPFQLFFSVSDVRRTAAQLRALQIAVEEHKSTLSIQDPDGNQIVFVKVKPY